MDHNTSELLAALRRLLKEGSASNWSDDDLVGHLNDAYGEVYGQQQALFEDFCIEQYSFNIVSGQSEYDLPSDCKKLRNVEFYYQDRYYRVPRVRFTDRLKYQNNVLPASHPGLFHYCVLGNQIILVPEPDTAVTNGIRLTYNPHSGELAEGIVQSGCTATTLVMDSYAANDDDAYNNMEVAILSGTGAGQVREITDYDGQTKVATVEAWDTTPAEDDTYAIVPKTRKPFDRVIVLLAGAHASFNHDRSAYRDLLQEYERRLDLAKREVNERIRGPRYIRHIPRR
jgi:hypothetical protein